MTVRMTEVSYAHATTGAFHSKHLITNDPSVVALNCPPDHLPIEGIHDQTTKRYNWKTNAVEYIPEEERPAPSPAVPIPPAQRIAALEAQQARPLRELALGGDAGAARAKLGEIEAKITSLRAELTAGDTSVHYHAP